MFRKKQVPASDMPAPAPKAVSGPVRPSNKSGPSAVPPRTASPGKQAYESRRAAKAGMGLEKWMAEKERRVQAEREAVERARRKAAPRKPGLLRRLLDKAHRPI